MCGTACKEKHFLIGFIVEKKKSSDIFFSTQFETQNFVLVKKNIYFPTLPHNFYLHSTCVMYRDQTYKMHLHTKAYSPLSLRASVDM